MLAYTHTALRELTYCANDTRFLSVSGGSFLVAHGAFGSSKLYRRSQNSNLLLSNPSAGSARYGYLSHAHHVLLSYWMWGWEVAGAR